jgi:hypothetical protein
MKFLKNVLLVIAQGLQFILWHFPISIFALVGLYFGFKLFINSTIDTINITNYSFVVVATLSALSFTYEKAIVKDQKLKDDLRYCGERFLHSAILFLTASILKYFLCQPEILSLEKNSVVIRYLLLVISMFPPFLFLGSLVNGIAALRELNAILYGKKKPFEELRKIF